jgi:hypothetical protein
VHDDALARLTTAGFDIAHAFDTHAAAREPGWERLADGPPVGILVGNTRALWPVFTAARRDEPDALDRYTERSLTGAYPSAPIYFAHRAYDGAFLPFSRLAAATGLGALAPSHLVIHPIYGPWFALRGLVLVDGTAPVRTPIPQPCTCDGTCEAAFAAATADPSARDWRCWLAVRDACSLRTHRYDEDQLRYHYTRMWGPITRSDQG